MIRLSGLDEAILRQLPFEGLMHLAKTIQCNDLRYVRQRLHRLSQNGMVKLEYPEVFGRGHKIIIRRTAGG